MARAVQKKRGPVKERRGSGIPIRTSRTRDDFLTLIGNNYSIKRACETLEISRSAVHKWMREDEAFLAEYNDALENARDGVRDEVIRRGMRGVRRLRSMGGKVIVEREYSDRMLELAARMMLPEASGVGAAQVTVNNNTMNVVQMTDEQLADALRQRGIPIMAMDE